MLNVTVIDVSANDDGTYTAFLECDGTRVRCEGAAWFDECDADYMLALFEEWVDLAREGEEGYTIL